MNCSSDLGGFFNQFSAQNANTVIPRECVFEFSAVQQMKSVFDADCFNLISQARILEAEFRYFYFNNSGIFRNRLIMLFGMSAFVIFNLSD